jgi:hypothetical protein
MTSNDTGDGTLVTGVLVPKPESTFALRTNQKYDWEAIAALAKDNPDQLVRVGDDVIRSRKRAIERGEIPAFRDGVYVATTRQSEVTKNDPARATLYVRYAGPLPGRSD